ncbi:MAG TPA: hypothetical protein VER79_09280 [Candidatus Limnocylindrales bacterium]|nr:hypothetical protein [Candidatus Limnocylindrales bacterium]
MVNGALASRVGQIMGVGVLILARTVAAFLYGPMRRVERDLPDVTPDDPPPPAPAGELEPAYSATNIPATA